jgi:hypothetical protein
MQTVRVCKADILRLKLPRQPCKVFSNIPFDNTAEIVKRLTRTATPPDDAYLVVQREACERFLGQPKTTLVSVLLCSMVRSQASARIPPDRFHARAARGRRHAAAAQARTPAGGIRACAAIPRIRHLFVHQSGGVS